MLISIAGIERLWDVNDWDKRDSEESLPEVSDRLSEDLKALFGSDSGVPGEVDRAVLDAARRRLVKPRRRKIVAWGKWVGAAAAVVLILFVLNGHLEKSSVPDFAGVVQVAGDVDGNGRVDVLDAFKLARFVESPGGADVQWDMNGDEAVDRADVDAVAFTAVRLKEGV